jgi:hypothetical protein
MARNRTPTWTEKSEQSPTKTRKKKEKATMKKESMIPNSKKASCMGERLYCLAWELPT